MQNRTSKSMTLGFAICSLMSLVISTRLLEAQATSGLTQEAIDKRVVEIMDHALRQDTMTTSEGVPVTPMRAAITLAELKEIRIFGHRAIGALSKYFDSTEYRAQTLAVNLVGAIGGREALKPLTYAAERCVSPVARLVAVENLGQQPWPDVADVMRRVSASDSDQLVRKRAAEMIEKHRASEIP